MLERLLREIVRQESREAFTFSVVVVDNDAALSAQPVVERCARECSLEMVYTAESRKNIALARNMAISKARGDFIAFIDDDEFPTPGWLANLFQLCQARRVDGVLGPVKTHYAEQPPGWVVKGRFYERRPEHVTGYRLTWEQCRTGNVLFRHPILATMGQPFRPQYGTGGEDEDFFRRAMENGHTFVWCSEAEVYETVPSERWQLGFMFKRALLCGKNSFQHRKGRWPKVAKSLIAMPVYTLASPFFLLRGYDQFILCLVKVCEHSGRILALIGLNPMKERP